MYATVRRYEGVTDPQEATNRVREGLMPIVKAMPGLVEYDWVDLGKGAMLSVSVFDSLPNAIEANQAAVGWIRTNLATVLTHNPRIEVGEVVAHKCVDKDSRKRRIAAPASTAPAVTSGSCVERLSAFAAQQGQQIQQHATARRYEGVADTQEVARQVRDGFVPVISALPGFIAYYWINLGNGAFLAVSIFDSLANAIESGHAAAAWVKANLSTVLKRSPVIDSGKIVAKA